MRKIHKISNNTPFRIMALCGIYPEKEYQITSENIRVTCKRCKKVIYKK